MSSLITIRATNRDDLQIDQRFASVEEFGARWPGEARPGHASPALTVIIPAYKAEKYIAKAIDSVAASAAHLTLELLVVDDGSPDATAKVASETLASQRHFAYAVISTANRGLSAVRNLGIACAHGDFIAFLDSDDFVAPTGYAKLVKFGLANDCEQVFGRAVVFNPERAQWHRFPDAWAWDKLLGDRNSAVLAPRRSPLLFATEPSANTRVWRRSYLKQNNIAYPEGRLFEDIGVHLKSMASSYRVGIVGSDFYFYRVGHAGQITSEKSLRRLHVIENLVESLDGELRSLGADIGAQITYSITRIVEWCGENTPFDHIDEFAARSARLYSRLPDDWLARFESEYPDHAVVRKLRRRRPSSRGRSRFALSFIAGFGAK